MENNKTIYINFFDGIDVVKVNKFIVFVNDAIKSHNPSEIIFLIASGGGDVDSGFVLYNYLVSLKPTITIGMHNVGKIDSIANVIFVAGEKKFASPNASFLFHGVSMHLNGSFNKNSLTESVSRLTSMELRIIKTISENSKLTETELESLFHQGEDRSVEFALEKEIIQEIKFPAVPAGAIHLIMNFQ
jgi:ATP-dependent protease ClpP protease subunit